MSDKTGTGNPYIKDMPVEFNISHSEDMAVCAVDDKPMGIYIEKIRPIDLKVAKRICTDKELICLFGHTPTEQDFVYTADQELLTQFFELWTAKEAFCKLKGIGIGELSTTRDNHAVQTKYILIENMLFVLQV